MQQGAAHAQGFPSVGDVHSTVPVPKEKWFEYGGERSGRFQVHGWCLVSVLGCACRAGEVPCYVRSQQQRACSACISCLLAIAACLLHQSDVRLHAGNELPPASSGSGCSSQDSAAPRDAGLYKPGRLPEDRVRHPCGALSCACCGLSGGACRPVGGWLPRVGGGRPEVVKPRSACGTGKVQQHGSESACRAACFVR